MKLLNYLIYLVIVKLFPLIFLQNECLGKRMRRPVHDTMISEDRIKETETMIEQSTNHTKEGLGKLFHKIDTNNDLIIVQEELVDWIIKKSEEMAKKEATDDIENLDENKDQEVSWEEYKRRQYGELSMEYIDKNKDHNSIIEFVKDDQFRFKVADGDKNGKLNINELMAFLRPHNHIEMLDYEVHRALRDHDKNNDKKIDKQEFILTQYGTHNLNVHQKTYVHNVYEKFDADHDGRLSEPEIKAWMKPDITDYAKTESKYLIGNTDKNNDQKLTKDEVLENFGHWINSHITNYGEGLKEEL